MMREKEHQLKNKLCKDCLHCRKKGKRIFCRKGYFDDIGEDTPLLFTPYDFDCFQFDGE